MTITCPAELLPLSELFEKSPPRVVVLVGTGVSMASTDAPQVSWRGLLKHGVDYLVDNKGIYTDLGEGLKEEIDDSFDKPQEDRLNSVLGVADTVFRLLKVRGRENIVKWLWSAFGRLEIRRTELLGELKRISQAGALLATTNYDSLMCNFTGLPPVTWQEHDRLLGVINRKEQGIIHLHGHWEQPESVILTNESYDRISRDEDFQTHLKGLWANWSWVYIGCGDGLDDPNLGPLLAWGGKFERGLLKDYFISDHVSTASRRSRADYPKNIRYYSYGEHKDLPGVLRSIDPKVRITPFRRVNRESNLFGQDMSPSAALHPSYQDYVSQQVPALEVDRLVNDRLADHGWAFVLDVTQVGKTTLAKRLATQPDSKNLRTYYFDLASAYSEQEKSESRQAFHRLARPQAMLILDNVHLHPDLAADMWEDWKDFANGSRLLLIGTKTQQSLTSDPPKKLSSLINRSDNPPVPVEIRPADLGRIAEFVYQRVTRGKAVSWTRPPSEVLTDWHQTYGQTVAAFCAAVRGRLHRLAKGDWSLPPRASAEWVRKNWLDRPEHDNNRLDEANLENAMCMAVFAGNGLEMTVSQKALPHQDQTKGLLKLGLVRVTEHGQFLQFKRFGFHSPAWAQLILDAAGEEIEPMSILIQTALRHPFTATVLDKRLQLAGLHEWHCKLWDRLAADADFPARVLRDLDLTKIITFVNQAEAREQWRLVGSLWKAVEDDPLRIVEKVWETHLQFGAAFLEKARDYVEDVGRLWEAVESDRAKLTAALWNTPLGDVGFFLETAARRGRNVDHLWQELVNDPERLAEKARETPLDFLCAFLKAVADQRNVIEPLWEALVSDPEALIEETWDGRLSSLGAFLITASDRNWDADPIWRILESDPGRLKRQLSGARLEHITAILNAGQKHGRRMDFVWDQLASRPDGIAELVTSSAIQNVTGVLTGASPDLLESVLALIPPEHWLTVGDSLPMANATQLANLCSNVDRNDHRDAIYAALLTRANSKDFPPQHRAMGNVVWLLTHVPPGCEGLVPNFRKKVCTEGWMNWQYYNAESGPLARALRELTFLLPEDMQRLFRQDSLDLRIQRDLLSFPEASNGQRSRIIQFLGSCVIFGRTIDPAWVGGIVIDELPKLVERVLPHPADAEYVQIYQYQLWVGMRAMAYLLGGSIPVSERTIDRTLALWKGNLEYSEKDMDSTEHEWNIEMISWLRECHRQRPTALIPPNGLYIESY